MVKKSPPRRKRTSARRTRAGSSPKRRGRGSSVEQLREYVRARGAEFLKDPNVTSVGIGQREDGGYCLRFTVAKKVTADDKSALESLGTQLLPEAIDVAGEAVPVEVVNGSSTPRIRSWRRPPRTRESSGRIR